jgi:type IV pilus assembly protein PilQ
LKLEVTPSITPDGRIVLDLELNQDSVAGTVTGEFGAEIPFLDTNSIVTQVLVDNGQTIVLGGVYQTREVENEVKTPILGDIPYLGRFFRKNFKDYQKQELLMFITPRILADSLLD